MRWIAFMTALLALPGCVDEPNDARDGNVAPPESDDDSVGPGDDDARPEEAAASEPEARPGSGGDDICAEHDAWFDPSAYHDLEEFACFGTPLSLAADGSGQTRCWIFNHRSCTTPPCDPQNYDELVACAAGELIPETCPNCATDGSIALSVAIACSGTGRAFVGNCGLDCPPDFCDGALHPENQVTVDIDGQRWISTTVDFRGFPPNLIEARNATGDRITLSWAGNTTIGSHDLTGTSGLSKGGLPGVFSAVVEGTIDVTSLDNDRMTATFEMTTSESQANETLEFTGGSVDIQPY